MKKFVNVKFCVLLDDKGTLEQASENGLLCQQKNRLICPETGRGSPRQIKESKEYLLKNQDRLAGFINGNRPFWVHTAAKMGFKSYEVPVMGGIETAIKIREAKKDTDRQCHEGRQGKMSGRRHE